MLNSLARNKGSRRWLGLCLFAMAFLFVALVSGCGGSGSSGSGGGAPAKEYSDVIFHFNNLASETLARAVPDGTTHIRFTGSTSSREVLYGPTTRDYAPTITLEKVPVKVTGFVLECLNSNNGLTAIIPVKVELNGYRDTVVEINDYKELKDVVKNVVVNPTSINNLLIGYSESIAAVATLSDGQIVDITPYLTFTSSNPSVATVEQNGYDGAKVTASKGGDTVISGSVLGVSMPDIAVTVNGGVAEDSVGFEPKELQVAPSIAGQSRAFVYFNNGTKKNLDASKVTYSVKPEGIVTVEAASASGPAICKVTGVSSAQVGDTATVTMTATLSDGSTQTADMKVTIIESVPIGLTITNDTTSADWPADLGENKLYSSKNYSASQFTATAQMSNGSTQDVTSQVTWTSSNEEAAKFDEATPGKLQAVGVAPATATVTATYGSLDSTAIDMEIISPSVVKLEVTSIADLEAGVILSLESGKAETVPYSILLKATKGNGEEEYPTIEGGLVAEHLINSEATKSEDYLRFEDSTTAGTIYLYGKKTTGELAEDTWMKFTYQGISTEKIPVKVVDDKLKVFTINFIDQTTNKSYSVLKKDENYELAVPYGRKYTISLHGKASSGKDMGDISGNYYYAYFPKYNLYEAAANINTLSDQGSVSKSNPIAVSGIITDPKDPNYCWSETPEVASITTGYSPNSFSSEGKRGEHRYNYVATEGEEAAKGEIVVVARDKSTDEEAFRVKLYFAEPAVDSYLINSYGAHSRRGDNLTFDIPRGTEFKLGTYQEVIGVMSDIDEVTNDHRLEIISEHMTVDASSVKMDNTSFILDNPATNVFTSVDSQDDYNTRNNFNLDYAQMKNVVVDNEWDEEGYFGQESVGQWLSYNCENPGFIFRLERPIVTSADVKVLDSNKQPVEPDAKGKYHFKQDEKFYCYYADVVTSDHQELYKDLEILATTSEILGLYVDGNTIYVLEHVKILEDGTEQIATHTDPYHMLVSREDNPLKNGYTSSVTLIPDENCYYDASAYNVTKNITLDIP